MQRELDIFSKEVLGGEFNIRTVTKGAFSQARAKLNPEAFKILNREVVEAFYEGAPYQVWHNKRLLAIDGSRLMLPKHETVREEFGEHSFGPGADSARSMAMVSLLYDPVNLITLDAQMAPYASSERDLLYSHLEYVSRGDVLLADRGYASFGLFFLLQARGIDFCIRIKDDWWLEARKLKASGQSEAIVSFALPDKDREMLAAYPNWANKKLTCRLVAVPLKDGSTEILCTSLTDTKKYVHDDFADLYHHRWGIEEAYKLLKARVEVERFSGKTALSVRQDFYAKIFMMTLCTTLAFPLEERVRQESAENDTKHKRKINRTSALSNLRDLWTQIYMRDNWKNALKAFDEIVAITTEIVRPNRKYERRHLPKRPFRMNYKPL